MRAPSDSLYTSPRNDEGKVYWFTIDNQLQYSSFYKDWGPLNISKVYKACILIHELLEVRVCCVVFCDVAGLELTLR